METLQVVLENPRKATLLDRVAIGIALSDPFGLFVSKRIQNWVRKRLLQLFEDNVRETIAMFIKATQPPAEVEIVAIPELGNNPKAMDVFRIRVEAEQWMSAIIGLRNAPCPYLSSIKHIYNGKGERIE
jgi:hypothetical protein